MSKFIINSYKNVGKIKFGESRDEVRKEFGEFTEFKKSKFSKNTSDDFKSFHVYYSSDDKVEAVEFFRESNLEYNGQNLFKRSFDELNYDDDHIETDGSSITYKTLGFSVYAPSRNEIESILVFAKGYYD